MQLPKPPKLFRSKPEVPAEPDPTTVPDPTTEAPRIWSPPPQPTMDEYVPEPEENILPESTPVPDISAPMETAPVAESSAITEPESETPVPEDAFAPTETTEVNTPTPEEDLSRYARPAESEPTISDTEPAVSEIPSEPKIETESTATAPVAAEPQITSEPETTEDPVSAPTKPLTVEERPFDLGATPPPEENEAAIRRVLGPDQKIVRAKSVSSIPFSDIWYTAENVAYIRDKTTHFALIPFLSDDLTEFRKALEQGYTGQSSYAIRFAGESYRVERIITLSGAQYNCRKMPTSVPDIFTLGLPKHIVDYLLTLSQESGLILFGGPTGMGKTTSASALMQKFLEAEGGFMYTIEDPPEMPLDGLYHAQNGGLGLCKQCPVDNERWGDGIKSALRSRPRYILVGEIRTPETASQVLRAATSGHLVLSTIHASTVEDALESIIKYASGAGLTESLAADLLARGILAVIHQRLEGSNILRPVITAAFANPHLTGGDQMRSLIRNNNINLQTLVEAQSSRLFQGRPLFETREDVAK